MDKNWITNKKINLHDFAKFYLQITGHHVPEDVYQVNISPMFLHNGYNFVGEYAYLTLENDGFRMVTYYDDYHRGVVVPYTEKRFTGEHYFFPYDEIKNCKLIRKWFHQWRIFMNLRQGVGTSTIQLAPYERLSNIEPYGGTAVSLGLKGIAQEITDGIQTHNWQ